MRYIVIQNGARRGYAVPVMLEQAGMLERLYTDLCGSVGMGKLALLLQHLPGIGKAFSRLAGRKLPKEVALKTISFSPPVVRNSIRNWFARGSQEHAFRSSIVANQIFARRMSKAGVGQATHVYSMLSEGGEFLREARERGLTVISEVYILISTERILMEERNAFPDWEPSAPDYAALRKRCQVGDFLLNSDYLLCPSEAVQRDLVDNWNVNESRTRIVPYGMSPHWLTLESQPVQGRILFVGTAELRKGIHYLAMAASTLKAHGYRYEFRIAGNVSDTIRNHPICRDLTFLGRIPRSQIHEEFQRADLFVLPSLAEGSAEVTYEALAAAVPVVVTPSAGSVARDGIEGRIIPERDAPALADAIAQIVENRSLRESMSLAARERAKAYTWQRYGERLTAALLTCHSQR